MGPTLTDLPQRSRLIRHLRAVSCVHRMQPCPLQRVPGITSLPPPLSPKPPKNSIPLVDFSHHLVPVRLTTPPATTKAMHLLSCGRGIPTSSETARSCHAISVNGAACSTAIIITVMCCPANHQPQAACLQGWEPSSALAPADGSRSATSPLPQRPLCAVASSVKALASQRGRSPGPCLFIVLHVGTRSRREMSCHSGCTLADFHIPGAAVQS